MECPVGAGPKFNELLRFGGATQLIESLRQYINWGFVLVILGICLGDFHAGCWHVDFDVPPPSSSPPHFHGFPHFWDVQELRQDPQRFIMSLSRLGDPVGFVAGLMVASHVVPEICHEVPVRRDPEDPGRQRPWAS